ncbi:MAG: hypothetical protein ABEK84_07570 [Salinibacter sp.]
MSPRLWRGFWWGVGATVAMSIPMTIGMATGVAPMPEPIPKALVTLVFGAGLPAPLLMALSAGSHLGYGGVFGAVLARFFPEAGLKEGLVLGVLLWLVMEVVVLPTLGWGVFGVAVTPKIAVATLVLHLIYGATLGWGLGRSA